MAFAERENWQERRGTKRRPGGSSSPLQTEHIPMPDGFRVTSTGKLTAPKGTFEKYYERSPDVTYLSERTEPQRQYKSKIKRNIVLSSALALGIATSGIGIRVGASAVENNSYWEDASVPSSEFLDNNRELFSHVTLGCSFAPEQFGITLENLNTPEGQRLNRQALDALEYIQNDLNIKDIRIGIRWDNVYNSLGQFDFSLYKPYFDSLVDHKANIALNFGIKVFRWPEDHVPQKVLDGITEPANGSIIYPSDELSKKAMLYTNDLFGYLQSTYSEGELAQVKIVQPNNEPFVENFGERRWRLSEESQTIEINEARKIFPNAKILINSAGFFNLDQISNYFEKLIAKDPQLKNNLILGIDYYPIDVGYVDAPIVGKFNPENIPLIGKVDAVFYDEILFNKFENIKNQSKNIGFEVEITELQAEPWDGNPTLPGDTVVDFKYATKRGAQKILDPSAENSVMRVWGIEYLFKNQTTANKEILSIIKEINSKSSD